MEFEDGVVLCEWNGFASDECCIPRRTDAMIDPHEGRHGYELLLLTKGIEPERR